MNYLLPERLDRLAREYALGTLDGRARRRFERVMRQSPAAALAVAVWQERLAGLAAGVPPIEPRAAVWQALERRLFAPADAAAPRPSAWAWIGQWLSARTLGGAFAGVLLCVLLLRAQPGLIDLEPASETLPASYVGLLSDPAGQPTVLASSRRHGRVLTIKMLQPVAVPAGRVAQLWALPKDGSAPFPVGTVPAQGSGTLTLADSSEKLFFKVARLAVSFEPGPAKVGDKPTGEFVLSGACVKLW